MPDGINHFDSQASASTSNFGILSPLQFVRQVIEALRPLLVYDDVMDSEFIEGCGEVDAYRALAPVSGACTAKGAASPIRDPAPLPPTS